MSESQEPCKVQNLQVGNLVRVDSDWLTVETHLVSGNQVQIHFSGHRSNNIGLISISRNYPKNTQLLKKVYYAF